MKIRIIQVGKDKDSWISEGGAEYLKRLGRFCEVDVVTLKEVGVSKSFSTERAISDEGDAILDVLGDGFVVALSEEGKEMESVDFAKFIEGRKDEGERITFVIGGAYGLAGAVKERADLVLSFSKMTFTHQMIRMILLEQLYRAFCIVVGKDYHH